MWKLPDAKLSFHYIVLTLPIYIWEPKYFELKELTLTMQIHKKM